MTNVTVAPPDQVGMKWSNRIKSSSSSPSSSSSESDDDFYFDDDAAAAAESNELLAKQLGPGFVPPTVKAVASVTSLSCDVALRYSSEYQTLKVLNYTS
jgi:hypothetical protein